MSRDSGIYVEGVNNLAVVDVVKSLMSHGWSFDYYEEIGVYLGNDNGWTSFNRSEKKDVLDIIKQRAKEGKEVGITMTWKETNNDFDVLFLEEKKLIFSLSNRKTLSNSEFTDVSWYLERILPSLESIGLEISCVSWKEII